MKKLLTFTLLSLTYSFTSDISLLQQNHGVIKQAKKTKNSNGNEEKKCIAEALWYEARGEGKEGMMLVLSVIHNRVVSKAYPDTYCKVIKQYKQFSYRNAMQKEHVIDIAKKPVEASESITKARVLTLADNAVKGAFKPLLKPSVTHYHTKDVKPYWGKQFKVEATKGKHVFLAKK